MRADFDRVHSDLHGPRSTRTSVTSRRSVPDGRYWHITFLFGHDPSAARILREIRPPTRLTSLVGLIALVRGT